VPTAVFIKSAASPKDFPDDSGREVAFVGRSNSGKSTALNLVAGARKLARVSKTPGRTQLVNFFSLGEDRRTAHRDYSTRKQAPHRLRLCQPPPPRHHARHFRLPEPQRS
jgi:hypothetical protein